MAPTFTYDEINSDQSQVTADGLRNVGNVAADFVCDLWSDYAEWTSGFADPTGIGRINNALFSRLCTPRGKQPAGPPMVAFTGGQCDKLYHVTYSLKYGPNDLVTNGTIFNVQGPVRGVATKPGTSENSVRIGILGSPSINNVEGFWNITIGLRSNVLPYEVTTFTVVPASGSDTCGDPLPSYPPKTPPGNQVQKPVNVNIGAGVVIPVVATFAPIFFRPEVEINPQFQVDVGPFNVTFDAGGVTIAPNFQFGGDGKTLPPPSSYPINNVDIKNQNNTTTACDLSPVTTRLDNLSGKVDAIDAQLDDIEECTCPVGYQVSVVGGGSGNSGVIPLPSRTVQVKLNLTKIPANPKAIQSGGENAPLQYFCGYFSFGDGVGLGARTAINTAQSVFEVPTWASSFSWSLYTGYEASVSLVTLVPDKPNAQLATRQLKMPPS